MISAYDPDGKTRKSSQHNTTGKTFEDVLEFLKQSSPLDHAAAKTALNKAWGGSNLPKDYEEAVNRHFKDKEDGILVDTNSNFFA